MTERELLEVFAKIKSTDEHPEAGEIRLVSDFAHEFIFCRGNLENGLYERWDSQGDLKMQIETKNGYIVSNILMLKLLRADDDHPERGEIREAHTPEGHLSHYERGDKQNGLYESWYPDNGIQAKQANYKNGELDGLYEEWDFYGTPIVKQDYEEGILVKDYFEESKKKRYHKFKFKL